MGMHGHSYFFFFFFVFHFFLLNGDISNISQNVKNKAVHNIALTLN